MFFKGNMFKENENTPVGILYAKDGAEFVIEELSQVHSRQLSKIYEQAQYKPARQLIIKNNGATFEPYEIVAVPLDLTKSSETSNLALLEYLKLGGVINKLLTESIVDTTTLLEILNTPQYRNELTLGYCALHQNMFVSEQLIDKMSVEDKLKLFTTNIYRTPEIMSSRKSEFYSLLEKVLTMYVMDEKDLISENPSELRVNIVKTCNTYYDKDVSIQTVKNKILLVLNEKEDDANTKLEAVQIIKEAVSKYKITGDNWKEKKESIQILCDKMQLDSELELETIQKKINTIKNFPI